MLQIKQERFHSRTVLPSGVLGDQPIEIRCRTFYDLNLKRPATTTRGDVPGLCPWWFPHPHSFLPPDTEWRGILSNYQAGTDLIAELRCSAHDEGLNKRPKLEAVC